MARAKAVGIDLGTTYSAVARIDETGRSAMVYNSEGDLLTPSVVFFDDAEVVVGKEARSATGVHPDKVAQWVKREMGSSAYSRPIRGEHLPPEVIQACILRKLRADIADALGPDVKVVITVPAYFDEPRRKATADAGDMAGLTVLDIVNEPTAAALAFGEVHGYLSPAGRPLEEMTVLVYDLGGGTFDVTLLRLAPGDIRTLATDGDVLLGGHDWDMRLADHVADAFRQTHGADPRKDAAALNRLLDEVVDAKHALSARSRATIRFNHAGQSSRVEVTRSQFEELTADLLDRTAYTTRELLTAAKLEWSQISRLLLVGGSTRMPMVSQMLQQMSGIMPDHTVHPDEAVARGAALYASYLLAKRSDEVPEPAFQVTNVSSHSLGVEGIEQETLRKMNVVLIPRNTPLPAQFTEKFTTKKSDQRSIVVQVLEGESTLPGECTPIGRTVIRNLPAGLPRGWPVEVTFEYAANGRLAVQAVVPGTDRRVALEIEREVGLTSEGMSRWQQPVADSAGFDAFEAVLEEVLQLKASQSEAASAADSAAPPAPSAAQAQPAAAQPPEGSPPASGPQAPPDRPDSARPPSHPRDIPAAKDQAEWDRPDEPVPKPVPRWLINVVGLIVSAIIGLGLGYLIVSWLFPESGLLRLW